MSGAPPPPPPPSRLQHQMKQPERASRLFPQPSQQQSAAQRYGPPPPSSMHGAGNGGHSLGGGGAAIPLGNPAHGSRGAANPLASAPPRPAIVAGGPPPPPLPPPSGGQSAQYPPPPSRQAQRVNPYDFNAMPAGDTESAPAELPQQALQHAPPPPPQPVESSAPPQQHATTTRAQAHHQQPLHPPPPLPQPSSTSGRNTPRNGSAGRLPTRISGANLARPPTPRSSSLQGEAAAHTRGQQACPMSGSDAASPTLTVTPRTAAKERLDSRLGSRDGSRTSSRASSTHGSGGPSNPFTLPTALVENRHHREESRGGVQSRSETKQSQRREEAQRHAASNGSSEGQRHSNADNHVRGTLSTAPAATSGAHRNSPGVTALERGRVSLGLEERSGTGTTATLGRLHQQQQQQQQQHSHSRPRSRGEELLAAALRRRGGREAERAAATESHRRALSVLSGSNTPRTGSGAQAAVPVRGEEQEAVRRDAPAGKREADPRPTVTVVPPVCSPPSSTHAMFASSRKSNVDSGTGDDNGDDLVPLTGGGDLSRDDVGHTDVMAPGSATTMSTASFARIASPMMSHLPSQDIISTVGHNGAAGDASEEGEAPLARLHRDDAAHTHSDSELPANSFTLPADAAAASARFNANSPADLLAGEVDMRHLTDKEEVLRLAEPRQGAIEPLPGAVAPSPVVEANHDGDRWTAPSSSPPPNTQGDTHRGGRGYEANAAENQGRAAPQAAQSSRGNSVPGGSRNPWRDEANPVAHDDDDSARQRPPGQERGSFGRSGEDGLLPEAPRKMVSLHEEADNRPIVGKRSNPFADPQSSLPLTSGKNNCAEPRNPFADPEIGADAALHAVGSHPLLSSGGFTGGGDGAMRDHPQQQQPDLPRWERPLTTASSTQGGGAISPPVESGSRGFPPSHLSARPTTMNREDGRKTSPPSVPPLPIVDLPPSHYPPHEQQHQDRHPHPQQTTPRDARNTHHGNTSSQHQQSQRPPSRGGGGFAASPYLRDSHNNAEGDSPVPQPPQNTSSLPMFDGDEGEEAEEGQVPAAATTDGRGPWISEKLTAFTSMRSEELDAEDFFRQSTSVGPQARVDVMPPIQRPPTAQTSTAPPPPPMPRRDPSQPQSARDRDVASSSFPGLHDHGGSSLPSGTQPSATSFHGIQKAPLLQPHKTPHLGQSLPVSAHGSRIPSVQSSSVNPFLQMGGDAEENSMVVRSSNSFAAVPTQEQSMAALGSDGHKPTSPPPPRKTTLASLPAAAQTPKESSTPFPAVERTPGGSALVNPFAPNGSSTAAGNRAATPSGSLRPRIRKPRAPCFVLFNPNGSGIIACFNSPEAAHRSLSTSASGAPLARASREQSPQSSSAPANGSTGSRIYTWSTIEAMTSSGSAIDRKGMRGTKTGRRYANAMEAVAQSPFFASAGVCPLSPSLAPVERLKGLLRVMCGGGSDNSHSSSINHATLPPLQAILSVLLDDAAAGDAETQLPEKVFLWSKGGAKKLAALLTETATGSPSKANSGVGNGSFSDGVKRSNASRAVGVREPSPINAAYLQPSGKAASTPALLESGLARVQTLLCEGEREAAVDAALECGLYTHAILIAMMCPTKDPYMRSVRAVVGEELDPCSPLAHAYCLFNDLPLPPFVPPPAQAYSSSAGSSPSGLLEAVSGDMKEDGVEEKEARAQRVRDRNLLKTTWRQQAAMLVSNYTRSGGEGLLALGDTLQRVGLVPEAHTCFLLVHLCPLASPSATPHWTRPRRPDQCATMEQVQQRLGVLGGFYHPTESCRNTFLSPLTTLLTDLLQEVRLVLDRRRRPPSSADGDGDQDGQQPLHALPARPPRYAIAFHFMQVLWLREVGMCAEADRAMELLLSVMPAPSPEFAFRGPPCTLNELVVIFGKLVGTSEPAAPPRSPSGPLGETRVSSPPTGIIDGSHTEGKAEHGASSHPPLQQRQQDQEEEQKRQESSSLPSPVPGHPPVTTTTNASVPPPPPPLATLAQKKLPPPPLMAGKRDIRSGPPTKGPPVAAPPAGAAGPRPGGPPPPPSQQQPPRPALPGVGGGGPPQRLPPPQPQQPQQQQQQQVRSPLQDGTRSGPPPPPSPAPPQQKLQQQKHPGGPTPLTSPPQPDSLHRSTGPFDPARARQEAEERERESKRLEQERLDSLKPGKEDKAKGKDGKGPAKPSRSRSLDAILSFFGRGKSAEKEKKEEEAKPMILDTAKPPKFDPVTGRWMFEQTAEEKAQEAMIKAGPPKITPKKAAPPPGATAGGGPTGRPAAPTEGGASNGKVPPPPPRGRPGGPGQRPQYVDMFNS